MGEDDAGLWDGRGSVELVFFLSLFASCYEWVVFDNV